MSITMAGAQACAEMPEIDEHANDRLPPNARVVLEALRESDQPLKAYGLLERLQDRGINAPMTVYRALDRLIAEGLVRKIESLNAFVALPSPLGEPVAFIICRQCGRARTERLDASGCAWLRASGVDAAETYIEAYTDCLGCDEGGVLDVVSPP